MGHLWMLELVMLADVRSKHVVVHSVGVMNSVSIVMSIMMDLVMDLVVLWNLDMVSLDVVSDWSWKLFEVHVGALVSEAGHVLPRWIVRDIMVITTSEENLMRGLRGVVGLTMSLQIVLQEVILGLLNVEVCQTASIVLLHVVVVVSVMMAHGAVLEVVEGSHLVVLPGVGVVDVMAVVISMLALVVMH